MKNYDFKFLEYQMPLVAKPFPKLGVVALSGMFQMDAQEVAVTGIPTPVSATPDYGDDDCDHGFLVHDPDEHGHLYHCKICDERFKHHPGEEPEQPLSVIATDMMETIGKFHSGIVTLKHAMQETNMEVNQFVKVWKENFPPDSEVMVHQTCNSPIVDEEVLSRKPPRTTCPQVIEKLFENPDVTVSDLQMILRSAFQDIVGVEHSAMEWAKAVRVEIEFCDGSTQLVIMNDMDVERKRGWNK